MWFPIRFQIVTSPVKQAEICEVVNRLARFSPTKIAVEVDPYLAEELNARYRTFLEGRHTLGPKEVEQLGFRLAQRLGHPSLYPIDAEGEFPYVTVMEYARKYDPAFVQHMEQLIAQYNKEAKDLHKGRTVGEVLRILNDHEHIAKDHAVYMEFARLGYLGALLLSKWYERNIRIFCNLKRITEPNDRVLVIFGAGHVAILRHLIQSDLSLELVDPHVYLS